MRPGGAPAGQTGLRLTLATRVWEGPRLFTRYKKRVRSLNGGRVMVEDYKSLTRSRPSGTGQSRCYCASEKEHKGADYQPQSGQKWETEWQSASHIRSHLVLTIITLLGINSNGATGDLCQVR